MSKTLKVHQVLTKKDRNRQKQTITKEDEKKGKKERCDREALTVGLNLQVHLSVICKG